MSRVLRVGTRGSALALRQTDLALEALRAACPDCELEVFVLSTRGDQLRDAPITALGDGAFTKTIEAALRDSRIDLAVHSAKDLPVEGEASDLVLAAFPMRGDPRDALLSRHGETLATLRPNAVVATGSPRRAAQLLARRPDLEIVGVRGNVDTRIRKLRAGEFDGLILAAAGLERLGRLDEVDEMLDIDVMTPAAGQGALVVQCRAGDALARELAGQIDHLPTRQAVLAERAVLRRLGAGCKVPVAAFAWVDTGRLWLRGVLSAPDGSRLVVETADGPADQGVALGTRLAERLAERGAAELVELAHG